MASPQRENIVLVDDQWAIHLVRKLVTQRSNSKFCDVILKVNGTYIPVHSSVLAAVSPYFEAFLTTNIDSDLTQRSPQVVEIETDGAETDGYDVAVMHIVDYMYTGKAQLSDDNVQKISELARIMQIQELCDECNGFYSKDNEEEKVGEGDVSKEVHILMETADNEADRDYMEDTADELGSDAGQDRDDEVYQPGRNVKPRQVTRKRVRDMQVYECPEESCPYKTKYKTLITKHARTCQKQDRPPGRLKCAECDFTTDQSKVFGQHKKQHFMEKNQCYYCDVTTDSAQDLVEHIKLHTGPTPFTCTVCNKQFRNRTLLNVHMPRHTTVNSFFCSVCNKGFKWRHALVTHEKLHMGIEHICDMCGYTTTYSSQLKAHMLLHSGDTFKCTYEGCSYETIKKQNLKFHVLTHTRDKPHQCEICGQNFSLQKNMRRHKLLHATEKPYSCSQCEFTTARFDKLKEHIWKQHGIGGPSSRRQRTAELMELASRGQLQQGVRTQQAGAEPAPAAYRERENPSNVATLVTMPNGELKLVQLVTPGGQQDMTMVPGLSQILIKPDVVSAALGVSDVTDADVVESVQEDVSTMQVVEVTEEQVQSEVSHMLAQQ